MKKASKMKKSVILLVCVMAVCVSLAGCAKSGSGSGGIIGSYGAVALEPSEYGPRIQAGTTQDLVLFDNKTYMITVTGITWRSPDFEAGAAFENYMQTSITVFGTYEVTSTTEGDVASNPTKTIQLGDITRSIFGTTSNDVLETNDMESFAYLGDSDKLDDATKKAALAFFNPKTKTVIVDDTAFTADTLVGLTIR